MPKKPKASFQNSIYSGIILGVLFVLCGFVEIDPQKGPGVFRIVIGLITSAFFILSCLVFVVGFENFWEFNPFKASYWKANLPRIKRGLAYLISAIITAGVINTIINGIAT